MALGGHLTTISSQGENTFVYNAFKDNGAEYAWIGLNDKATEGQFAWVDGSPLTYQNWYAESQSDQAMQVEDEVFIGLTNPDLIQGQWLDASDAYKFPGIAEVPIISSITLTGDVKEGTGPFTTSINLSAGTQSSGNLAEGAAVYWQITGVTAEDLASGSLTGSGVISNGHLDFQTSLKVNTNTNEQFNVSVYSDASLTQQIGSTSSTTVGIVELGQGSLSDISAPSNTSFNEGIILTAGVVKGDPNGDRTNPNYQYQWYLNGNIITGANSASYAVGPTAYGTYKATVSYQDAQGFSSTLTSANQAVAKIDNGQGILSAITGNGAFNEGVTLTAGTISGDPDGAATPSAYQWYLNGNIITGANSASYAVGPTAYGTYKVAVTYQDAQGFSSTLTSTNQAVAKIDNGNASVAISGTAVVGNTLTASITTPDPDGNGSFSYQWQSFNGSTWDNLSGATATTYKLTSAELSKQVRVLVNSTDAQGYGPISITAAPTSAVAAPPDAIPPTMTGITVQGSSVILDFSEKIQLSGLTTSTFTVNVAGVGRSASAIAIDPVSQSKVTLTLSGTAPTASQTLSVSYSGTGTNIVKDVAGNSMIAFSNTAADSFIASSSVTTLATGYKTLTLSGSSTLTATGNAAANTILGNEANNTISGKAGADVLTGRGGADTFTYTTLADSLLGPSNAYTFDRITDFAIGFDKIDGPNNVSYSALKELGTIATLDPTGIAAVLTSSTFTASGAATFSFGSGTNTRTFLAINNGTAGYQASNDAIVEITGYSGLLTSLAVV